MAYPFRFGLFLAAYYVTNSVYQGFISIYYKDVGMNAAERGALIAAVSLISIFSQPFWGEIGDRSKCRARVIRVMCACALSAVLLFLTTDSFYPLLILVCLFAAFYTSIQPMGDSVILESLQKNNQPFGPIRWMGCVTFSISSMVFGRIVDKPGREDWTIFFTAGLLLCTFLATYVLPRTGGARRSGQKINMTALFKNRELMLLLALTLPLQLSMGYFYGFFSTHFTSLEGGTQSLLGWCFFISGLSETPFLFLSDKLFKRFGAGRMLLVSAAALTVRWSILATCSYVPVVMLSQILHGGGFIVITVCMAKYISLTVQPELRSSGQMLLAVTGFGISRVAGTFLGGLAAMYVGEQAVFYACAAITLLTFLGFAPYYLKKPALNGE